MSASYYPADAWGGQWVYGGGAPSSALAPSSAHQVQAQWDDTEVPDERYCADTSSKTNSQCQVYHMKDGLYCYFHAKKRGLLSGDVDGPIASGD